ncbi:unnamed protein product [Urochloa humidicola]
MKIRESKPREDEGWGAIPSDTLVGILLRLLPTPRRRLRLVCRHWRDVIDDRMPPARRARAKVLAYTGDQCSSSGTPRAYVLHDLIEGRSRELELPGTAASPPPPPRRRSPWHDDHDETDQGTRIVGTCNGLICLCRGRRGVVLFNPVTGEEQTLPPPPPLPRRAAGSSCRDDDDDTHGLCFAYHPATGLYKILRVPCRPGDAAAAAAFDAVHVFTLGEPSWREVPAPGSSCRFEFGLVAVRGVAYWVSRDARRVVSFDLSDVRAASVAAEVPVPVPSLPWQRYRWRLADVDGRLGFTVCHNEAMTSKTEVFVLEGGGGERMTWIRWYVVLVNDDQEQRLASPLLAHGEHLLTEKRVRIIGDGPERTVAAFYAHRPREDRALRCGVVPVTARSIGTAVLGVCDSSGLQTFSFVETMESLLV